MNPVQKNEDRERLEPDSQPIESRQARSAILFGPPGTSKTSLARAVAGAISWQYIELHASHFVADGLPNVQRTADDLFKRLMELDHTVILFDEVDELVRERDMEPDAFGRFLTTSMLPKLAELWKQRRVIYFIATNHIDYFDRAVTRAQRFDALLFVTPPSFSRKIKKIKELLREIRRGSAVNIALTQRQVDKALSELKCEDKETNDNKQKDQRLLPEAQLLAKFIMLRWDQLDELAVRLNGIIENGNTQTVSRDMITRALKEMSERISRNGGTPLAVADGPRVLGLIHLKDIVKGAMKERLASLRAMGIRSAIAMRCASASSNDNCSGRTANTCSPANI